ncbi:MBL fold metallo-hydrolase [Streptomyces sp. NPDC001880]
MGQLPGELGIGKGGFGGPVRRDQLADRVLLHDRRLTTIYITHCHGGHYLGLPVVLGCFPDARVVATARTVRLMQQQDAHALDNSLRARFPGQIADTIPMPEPLESPQIRLEGSAIDVIEAGHTDTLDTTSLHVPELGLIVSGDVAYNHCHMFVCATTEVPPRTAPGRNTSSPTREGFCRSPAI